MSRSSELRQFFWGQVSDAVGFTTWEVRLAARGPGLGAKQDVVTGVLDDLPVEVGAYWGASGQERVERTFNSVGLSGLPSGLEIDGTSALAPDSSVRVSPHPRVLVSCPGGVSKTVTVLAVPVDLNGLHLEQVSIDLDHYLTSDRRHAICNIGSTLQWSGGEHLVRRELDGLPYPGKRRMAQAVSGDVEAMRVLWEHRDRVVDMVRVTVRDAVLLGRMLRLTEPIVPPSKRRKNR